MAEAHEWWRTFFEGEPVELWLRAASPEMTRTEVEFLNQELKVAAGGEILDVPCGGGRHAVGLADLGYRLTGVDLSDDFLRVARQQSTSGAVTWEQREMRDLPWSRRFDAAFSFGNSFGYLGEPGDAEFLVSVANTIKPGGRFVLDTSNVAEVLLPIFQERSWYPFGDMLFLQERRYLPASGEFEVDYTFVRNGRLEKRSARQRVYPCRDVLRMVVDAGLEVQATYGGLGREPFRLGSGRLLLVTRR